MLLKHFHISMHENIVLERRNRKINCNKLYMWTHQSCLVVYKACITGLWMSVARTWLSHKNLTSNNQTGNFKSSLRKPPCGHTSLLYIQMVTSLQVKAKPRSSEGTGLPPTRRVNAIDLGQERQYELPLCKQWEIVEGNQCVWAATDNIFH